ncbi:MAG: Amidohydrolase 3 [Alphaproteobacteria bacterium]|jgi:N-acyl-D-aspartate/D-glutamate deacylase|nr:Amidohydrolase 3 [Alphaproteobacteria bacterium]
MLDLLIRDARIVDGTGRKEFSGDVGVRDEKIVEVGKVSGAANRTIDAGGRLLTPGFVDIHTHYDGQVSWDSVLAPSSVNGVTSVAVGNCGVGFAPARPDKHEFLINLLEGVEDIPGTALAEGLTWDWESFPDYLDALAKRSFAIDVGAHLPHAALRAYVMGERGADHTQEPSEAEIAEMARLTGQAMAAGALGFTTSRTHVHKSRTGKNIGTLTAPQAELAGIAAAMARSGKGVIQLISDAYLTADDDFATRELDLIAAMAKIATRPLSFTVQQTDDAPERWRLIFKRIEAMVASGLSVKAQVAPRPIGLILSFATTVNPFMVSRTWKTLAQSLKLEERLRALAQPEIKAAILAEHAARTITGLNAGIVHGFNRMFRMTDPVDYEPQESASLQAEAQRAGRPVTDYAYDVFLEKGGRQLIYQPLINYTHGNLDVAHAMLVADNTLFGLSDGGAHCGTICDGSFPTTTLALWSRGNKSGKRVPVEALVHGYTQRNAAHVGWLDRGVIAPGYLADLNVIDLDALSLSPPEIVQDLPAGGSRLLQTPHGYRYTIKNGVVSFENGEWTGELPGRLLRGARPAL